MIYTLQLVFVSPSPTDPQESGCAVYQISRSVVEHPGCIGKLREVHCEKKENDNLGSIELS